MNLISNNVTETEEIAKSFVKGLKGDEIVLLEGELGVGKTTFVKAVGKILRCFNSITSPTFNLMQIYSGGKYTIYHFDLYRIRHFSELENFGFFEYLEQNGIKFIEWAKNVNIESMLNSFIKIKIEKTGEFSRLFKFFYNKGD